MVSCTSVFGHLQVYSNSFLFFVTVCFLRLSGDHESCNFFDLYKFSDNTGILEVHKRLLAQPFMDQEVQYQL